MHKIKFKGAVLPLILLTVGTVLSTGLYIAPIPTINIELPILITGMFTLLSIISFFLFSKASAKQVVILSFTGMIFFIVITVISLLGLDLIGIKELSIRSYSEVNPAFAFLALLTSVVTVWTFVKLEPIENTRIKQADSTPKNQLEIEPDFLISLEPEPVKQDNNLANAEVYQEIRKAKPVENTPIKPEIDNKKPASVQEKHELALNTSSEVLKEPTGEIFFEESLTQSDIKPPESLLEENLGALPDISLPEISLNKEKPEKQEQIYDSSIFAEDNSDYIPSNVRLVEKASSKKVDISGQISCIGKLLVNHKDIENIIEINELIKQVENDSDGSNIITKILGEKLKENLENIEKENPDISNSTVSNKAGFTVASLIGDNSTEQTIGALGSGAFLTIQNYLTRINYEKLTKVFFETENCIHILAGIDSFIFYFKCKKEFQPVNHSVLKDLLQQNLFSEQDLTSVKNEKGLIETVITDESGSSSNDDPTAQKLALTVSAIFENLKVFITNIQEDTLNNMTIFVDDKVLTIKKSSGNIVAFVTAADSLVTLSEKFVKMEKLTR